MILPKAALVIPTYNAGKLGEKCFAKIQRQGVQPDVLVIDSNSADNTVELATKCGFATHRISQTDFNHGGTRNLAVSLFIQDYDIVIFMTQDAILVTDNAIENLLKAFDNPKVAAVYGRQLPHDNANPLAAHARLFNYPEQSVEKSQEDIPHLGIKTAFISNSFAAYRLSVFNELGGFPDNTILAEDMYLAAKMILAGYNVVYCAEATVQHSHNYTLLQEFQRYFDIGVFQKNESWIQKKFGTASSEGKKFVLSEIRYLWNNAPWLLPKAALATLMKWLGFKLGFAWQKLPLACCKQLSMYKTFWK
ncbi:glycosyltransferase family 2 protein [Testudinibacter sp. P80/BLE/0925]|uniref:glycosyltransferase family 2 protein n=1 Tax=Testudinibacter sp. TW-1 TaxID=3417757 RepID=UPI003D35DFAC